MIKKEVMTPAAKILEKDLEQYKSFSKQQVLAAEKDINQWFYFIVSGSGHGRIEIFIDSTKKIIDVNPTPQFRHFKN